MSSDMLPAQNNLRRSLLFPALPATLSLMTAALVEPELRQTPSGWLAVTAPGVHPRIGVAGDTEAEARENFHVTYNRWLEIEALPAPAREE